MFEKIKGMLQKGNPETGGGDTLNVQEGSQASETQMSFNQRIQKLDAQRYAKQTPEFLDETLDMILEEGKDKLKAEFEARKKAFVDTPHWVEEQMRISQSARDDGEKNLTIRHQNEIKYASRIEIPSRCKWYCNAMDKCIMHSNELTEKCESHKRELESLRDHYLSEIESL